MTGAVAQPAGQPPASAAGGEPIGPLLARLRHRQGMSQLRVAEQLCAAARMPTVSRHEISRWERGERIPGPFWLRWLATVLDAPLATLEQAAAAARSAVGPPRPEYARLWDRLDPAEIRAALDPRSRDPGDLRALAHAWLAGPPELHPPQPPGTAKGGDPYGARSGVRARSGSRPEAVATLADRLPELRRMDDLVGGVDLAGRIDRELAGAVALLPDRPGDGARQVLPVVAQYAQLAGWVHADGGDLAGARRAYRVALRAAASGGERHLAAHVVGALSSLSLAAGDPHQAALLARTAEVGARPDAPASLRALLLHRYALAAAGAGERRRAHSALAAADRVADRCRPDAEPPWLYWLDPAELRAMTGRCLLVLGRPLRAVPMLERPEGDGAAHPVGSATGSPGSVAGSGPRTAALYRALLGRAYFALGEVELACQAAEAASLDAIRAGSARAAAAVRKLHGRLVPCRDLPAVRYYLHHAPPAMELLPEPLGPDGRPPAAAGSVAV